MSVHDMASRKVKAIDKRIEKIEASLSLPSLSPAQRLQLVAERDEVYMSACFSASPPARLGLCGGGGGGGAGWRAGESDVERKREEAGER